MTALAARAPYLWAFVVAGIGVVLAHLVSLPLPFLLGPMFACLGAALLGVPMRGIKPLNEVMRTILGVAVGASFTPAVLGTMPAMWPTLLIVPVMILCVGVTGVPYFRRLWGYDFPTAYFSAMPGGLQDMIVFGEEAGANVRSLSLIHATRILVIVVALPVLLTTVWDADLSRAPGAPAAAIPPVQMLLMAVAGILGWQGAKRVGLFGASILGPMILTAGLTIGGVIEQRPPAEAVWVAQFFIGMVVGVKYSGITLVEVRRDLVAALGFCVILIVLTLIFAEAIFLLDLAPPRETLLAFAPGGQAELVVLALIIGADMGFVIAHHVLRICLVIVGAPIFARMFS